MLPQGRSRPPSGGDRVSRVRAPCGKETQAWETLQSKLGPKGPRVPKAQARRARCTERGPFQADHLAKDRRQLRSEAEPRTGVHRARAAPSHLKLTV